MTMNKLTRTALSFALSLTTATSFAQQQTWQDLGIMASIPPVAEAQVTSANWVMYPYNRWSFQNITSLLATVPVESGPTIDWPMGNNTNVLPFAITNSKGESTTIEKVLHSHNTDAFVVVHKGKLVHESYWNGMTPNSQHWLASMTKSFTGLTAEILIAEGKIDPTKRAKEYVSELKGTAMGSATVQQLLDMTAGTAWDESMEALMDETSFAREYGNAAGTWPMPGKPTNGVFGILPRIEQDREHGKNFVYNSPQTDAIGWVISAVTGQRFEEVMSDKFWSQLGAENHTTLMADTNTFAWATGGLFMTARDAAKFGQLIVNQGEYNGERIFDKSVYDRITTGDASKFADSAYEARIPGGAYSSFFWLTNNDDDAIMAKGMYAQYIYMNPTTDVVIVRLASPEISSMPEYDLDMLAVFDTISTHLSQ
ncbi:serine hydrolase domain-containing protein [Thaumasiovibrio subtropicus]|uniref:serine hydrolase domain-containing protein n=1 Tax=Thaumasiovibrio subtropicus TaxID=1891207 RepID=UPI000B3535CE|nr:serine hydrolase [Thaumasiovibrio subtropicus]